ncbi:hypothetical protein [Nocardia alba]|uniref:DUF4303 domain-containing protein n=1 Tax=Nocardia alba TaxID=225051 RepID=A0A4R1FRI3_9NOCA|nr:hypothetical protein [Nocardia alba]TCJ96810.1 hypothetical protein DFR71_2843 [Nocardia alba]
MFDFARLDAAILHTLRVCLAELRDADDSLAMMACGMVEDLTGFFVAGVGATWVAGRTGSNAEKAEWAWSPSEWPLFAKDSDDAAPGRVTSAIWALSDTHPTIDGAGQEQDADACTAILRRHYENRIVRAIQQMRAGGEFRDAAGNDVWIWLHSADDADPELDERSFAALQVVELARDFDDRFGAGGDRLLARLAARET